MPTYLGKSIQTVTEDGKLFATISDKLTEVVYATGGDLAKLPYDLAEGKVNLKVGKFAELWAGHV